MTTPSDSTPTTGPTATLVSDGASAPRLRTDHANCIASPVRRGQRVTLPAGTVVRSTNPSKKRYTLARAQQVTVHHTSDGWVDLWNDAKRGFGFVILPTLTWPGTGGYWCDVKITPELCQSWGLEAPALPNLHQVDRDSLDVAPGYGPGYDNRD